MLGPRNPIDWNRIPPEKRELANVWYLGSNKYLESWKKIAQENSVRMLGIEYCLATKERAQALGLEHEQWRKTMLAGCLSDQREIVRMAARAANILRDGQEVNVQTRFGTNLNFRLAGRDPIIGDSVVTEENATKGVVKFLPSGFVEVAADEDSAHGTVVYDAMIPVGGSKRIKGLTLQFNHGKVVKYTVESGIETFEDYMETGQGDIDKFAFFGVGLNSGLKHGFTQDDKALGGVTIGIGGNEDKGGKNRTSGNRHWWASMTRATVRVDGKIVLKDGAEFH
jgi:leucyl aminopeptidase (aminopeptidase T)